MSINIPDCRSEMSFGHKLMRRTSEATQANCKNVPVGTFVQNDISLLLGLTSRFNTSMYQFTNLCQETSLNLFFICPCNHNL